MEDQQCFAERVMQPAKFDELNPDNVEEEIKKMGLFEDDYMSDDDTKVRIFLFSFLNLQPKPRSFIRQRISFTIE